MTTPLPSPESVRAVLERLAALPDSAIEVDEIAEGLVAFELFFTLSPEEQAEVLEATPPASVTDAELEHFSRRRRLVEAAATASVDLPSVYGAGGAVISVARLSAAATTEAAARALDVAPSQLGFVERGLVPWTDFSEAAIDRFCELACLAQRTLVWLLHQAAGRELAGQLARLETAPAGASMFRDAALGSTPPESLRDAMHAPYDRFFAQFDSDSSE